MIALADALAKVLASCPALPAVETSLDDALGRVLAGQVTATEGVPPFANSAMDGFAVRACDTAGATGTSPARLKVIGTLAAGAYPEVVVGPGEALRIMTGAPFPDGADSVAVVESTWIESGEALITAPTSPGMHVRPAGGDLEAGQKVFGPGTVLGPGHLGVLASLGSGTVRVGGCPTVGVLSTGDELAEPGAALTPGQIRDSNRHALLALLRRDGYEAVDLGIARDDEAEIAARLSEGARCCDALLSSGGVSMGDFDLVKTVLDDLGEMEWMQVAIRPAKPFAFGRVGGVPVFGLPGNPVSSMVSYELLARPGLRQMAGHLPSELSRRAVRAVAGDASLCSLPDRVNYVRVVSRQDPDGRLRVVASGGQGSNLLFPMALADALAVVPPGAAISPGGEVEVLLLA